MDIEITCKYCNYKKVKVVYNQNSLIDDKCDKCGDTNLEIRDLSKTKIDGYKGCKPFPEKKDSKKDSDYNVGDGDWPYDLIIGGD